MTKEPENTAPARILICEDEIIVAEDLAGTLKELGYEVVGAVSTGEESIRMAEEAEPNLILMDIKLKGKMDGIEAAEHIRAAMDVPVVYVTAYGETGLLERAKLTNPYGYLTKPVGPLGLKMTVETALYKHEADKRVKESEQRLALALEGADLGWWDWNVQTGELLVNQRLAEIAGYSLSEVVPHIDWWKDLIHPEERPSVLKRLYDHLDGVPPAYEMEHRFQTKDGQWKWILVKGKVVERDDDGKALRIVGTSLDITDRKKGDEEQKQTRHELERLVEERTAQLRQSEEKLLAQYKAIPVPTYTWQQSGDDLVLVSYNDSAEEISRGEIAGFLGIKAKEMYHDMPNILEDLHRCFAEKTGIEREMAYRLKTTGEAKHLEVKYAFVPPDLVVVHTEDISERRQAEESLKKAYEDLERRVHERTADLHAANERLREEISVRLEAERALRASEERYRAIFTNAPVGIDVADSDGRLTSVNGTLCEMLGYTEGELLGRSFRDITFPRDLEFSNKNFEALVLRQIPFYDLTKRYVRKDGEVIIVRILTAPLLEQGSNDASVICVIEDITERERVGKALKESQRKLRDRDELFQAFMDNSPVVAFVKDEMGRYVYINKPWEKAFGKESSEVLGKAMQDVWPLESALTLRETDEVVLASNAPLEYVRFLTDPAGNDIHLWVYKFPLRDSYGNKLLGGLALDLTKQKNDEKALRESEEKYRQLVETMNDGVGIADAEGVVTYANQRFKEMLGYSRDEITALKIRDLVDGSRQFEFDEQFSARKKGHPGSYETVLLPKDGHPIPVIVSSTPVVDQHGTFSGALAVFTDISELKETQKKLLASLKEKEVLLQEIHHRVKNNLQLVLSLLRMQARKIDEPKALELLTDAQNRVFSIALVHEKLYESPNLSTIQIGHYVKALTNHVVHAYQGAHRLVAVRVDADKANFSIDTAVPLGMMVTELVSNVLRHAFPDGKVGELYVTLHALDDDWYELCVTDNGIGIGKTEDLGDKKSMGLDLVRTFTAQLDGRLEIESEKGTRVRMTFRDIRSARPQLHA